MCKYKLLALDMDETLLTSEKTLTSETMSWVKKASESGVIVVLATGRGMQRVRDMYDELGLNDPIVVLNGAEIWKRQQELLERTCIKKEDIHQLYELAVNYDAHFWGYHVDGLVDRNNWPEDMLKKEWLKFGMYHHEEEMFRQLKEKVISLSDFIEVTSSASTNLEISYKGISKKTGIEKVCQMINISMSEVMAIGDNLNDLALIQAAGLGVAMGNATDELKELADVVTTTNNQNGVAKAIENWLFTKKNR